VKHWLIYSILFSLAFLNVPRSFVHDCDHHEKHQVSDSGDSINADDCFVCEFQLDFFEVPNFQLPQFIQKANFAVIFAAPRIAEADFHLAYSLRGPPAIV